MSKNDSYGKKGSLKCFIGYINETDAFPVSLWIKLRQMNGYVKYFDSNNKCIDHLVHDKELLKKYNEIWNKISNLLKKGFDSGPVYNDKYIKTKRKIYDNRTNTNFQDNKIPQDDEYFTCLSVTLLDSVVNADKKYPQIFLEECKYAIQKKKKYINEELNLDESDNDESDNDKSNESDED